MKPLPVLCCTPGSAPLGVDERGELAARFKALADPTRVAILSMLACEDEVCVCVLTDQLDVSQPTISHHLKVLRDAGLIASERRANWAYYHLQADAEGWVREMLAGLRH